MPGKGSKITLKQQIDAPLTEIFRAFANAMAFCEWLCDAAQIEARRGGRFYLWWESGYVVNGEYLEFAPDKKITLTWNGAGEPGVSRVKVVFKPQADGVLVTLQHQDLGSDSDWKQTRKAFKQGWLRSLKNLKSVMETGQDLRLLYKPMLGFSSIRELSAEQAAQAGFPTRAGLLVEGVMEEMCAAIAGVQAGDFIVKLAGKKISSLADLSRTINRYQAGEKVKLVFFRGDEKISTKVELSRRPVPDIPAEAEVLAETVGMIYDRSNVVMDDLLRGISDIQAEYCSSSGEWSTKEILSHLIATEREIHAWMARRIEDQEADFPLRASQPVRIRAIISAFPMLSGLAAELKRSQSETVLMVSDLPEEFINQRRSYWRLGYKLLQMSLIHLQDHLNQMRTTLEKAVREVEIESGVSTLPESSAESDTNIPSGDRESQGIKWYEI